MIPRCIRCPREALRPFVLCAECYIEMKRGRFSMGPAGFEYFNRMAFADQVVRRLSTDAYTRATGHTA